MKSIAISLLTLPLISGLAGAATSFTENFDGTTSGPNMSVGTDNGGSPGSNSFATGDWAISANDGYRVAVRTNDADYALADFTLTAVVTVGSASAWSSPMIGMGTGNFGGATNGNLPSTSSFGAMARADVHSGSDYRFQLFDDEALTIRNGTNVGALSGGTHLMMMEWDALGEKATFSFDNGNDGSFEETFTHVYTGLTGSNSALFVGGGNGLEVSNVTLTVVPEPSATIFLGLAGLTLLRRRRQ